jgi:protein phosphatase
MRGNHESPQEFPFSSHDLPNRLVEQFGMENAKTAYDKLVMLFRLLTLVTIVQSRLLLVHGGLPTDMDLFSDFRTSIAGAQENHVRDRTLEELLWNDPRPKIDSILGWEPSRRGIGRHFGSSVSRNWLAATGTKVIVRGHEPCKGFRVDHEGMILTLFSSKEAYPAFESAFILISKDKLSSILNAYELSKYVHILTFHRSEG